MKCKIRDWEPGSRVFLAEQVREDWACIMPSCVDGSRVPDVRHI